MSAGAEAALQQAVLTVLRDAEGIKAKFGTPARVFDRSPRQAAYPHIEWVRQESKAIDGEGAELSEHRFDIAVMAREGDVGASGEGLKRVREVLLDQPLAIEGWRCVVLTPVYAGLAPTPQGDWRALVRLKAILEPVNG